jgi:hypothetical protein
MAAVRFKKRVILGLQYWASYTGLRNRLKMPKQKGRKKF